VTLGRIGRPHGLRGEVTIQPTTDEPDARFVLGSQITTDPVGRGPLTIAGVRWSGRLLVLAFEGFADRDAAETLRGIALTVDAASLPAPSDPDEFYDHQLIGLAVHDAAGAVLGEVVEVLHPPASPVLTVKRPDGSQELVPFVSAIVPVVDLDAGHLVVDPPDGMFG